MFEGKNWELTFKVTKVNGDVQTARSEFVWGMTDAQVIQHLRKRCEDIADVGSYTNVSGQATQIDNLDKTANKVYYSSPAEIYTYSFDNES